MRRWMVLAVMALMVAVPASGYAQTPSGDKMKDKMMKDDKMEKDKMMEKKDNKMEKMEKK